MAIPVKWNKKAVEQFDKALVYIEKESLSSAEKVKEDLLLKIDNLSKYPEQFNQDKFKTKNDGTFRAFEIHHYRVSYRFIANEIRIIRIRHTKMNPLSY